MRKARVINKASLELLEDSINLYMKDGYELSGPIVQRKHHVDSSFIQVMVKETPDEPEVPRLELSLEHAQQLVRMAHPDFILPPEIKDVLFRIQQAYHHAVAPTGR